MSQVFISYSRRDLAFVEHLARDLKAAGLDVWYDLSGLKAGTRWGKETQRAIKQSQYFVVVLSPDSVESEWVEREFLYAGNLKLKAIPVLYRSCDLPIWSLDVHYIDLRGKKYKVQFEELLKVLGVERREEIRKVQTAERVSEIEEDDGEHQLVPEVVGTGAGRDDISAMAVPPAQVEELGRPSAKVQGRRFLVGLGLIGLGLIAVFLVGMWIGSPPPACSIVPQLCPAPTETLRPTSTPVATLYDGIWVGTTSQNYRFAFTITHNAITSVSGTAAADSVGGICPTKIESLVDLPIYHPLVNDNLSINFPGDAMTLTITGKFSSSTSASGTLYFEATEDCKRSAQVTWTAAKQSGTPTSTPTSVTSLDPSIRNALDEIANKAPLYKTSFDYWGDFWKPSGNTNIENGIVIASSGSGFTGAQARVLTASRFAYTFDFRNPDSNPNHGPCETITTNGLFETSNWKGFDVLFHHNGYVELGRNIWPGNFERIAMSSNRFDFSKFNTVTVIVLGNHIGVFVNTQMALTSIDPKGSTVYTEQDLGAYTYAFCEFDNFKLWDLTALNP